MRLWRLMTMIYRYRLCKPPGVVRNPVTHLYWVMACAFTVVVSLYLLGEVTKSSAKFPDVHRGPITEPAKRDLTKHVDSEEEIILLIAVLSSVSEEGEWLSV